MKRSNRLVLMTNFFYQNPRVHVQLPYFTNLYQASKSSISEDLDIIDHMFKHEGVGFLQRLSGAAGGVMFIPRLSSKKSDHFVNYLCEKLEDPDRLLPGGYLYMSDILGDPKAMRNIGHIFASTFSSLEIDVVMTIETKGIPIAYSVASFLNVPVVIVRRDPNIIEGSSVSINYVSASSKKVQTMVLTRRSLQEGSNVCIIDDFMKAGGTINGMKSLLDEFKANVKAIGVLAKADEEQDTKVVKNYASLVRITNFNMEQKKLEINPGNYSQFTVEK